MKPDARSVTFCIIHHLLFKYFMAMLGEGEVRMPRPNLITIKSTSFIISRVLDESLSLRRTDSFQFLSTLPIMSSCSFSFNPLSFFFPVQETRFPRLEPNEITQTLKPYEVNTIRGEITRPSQQMLSNAEGSFFTECQRKNE